MGDSPCNHFTIVVRPYPLAFSMQSILHSQFPIHKSSRLSSMCLTYICFEPFKVDVRQLTYPEALCNLGYFYHRAGCPILAINSGPTI